MNMVPTSPPFTSPFSICFLSLNCHSFWMSHRNYTRMGSYRKWFKTIRRKVCRSSNKDIIVVYTNTSPSTHEESARYQDLNGSGSSSSSSTNIFLSHEDIAAIKLQAFFRGHLVRNPAYYFSHAQFLFDG